MSETILAHGAHPSVRRDHPRGGRQGQGVAGPRPSEALQAGPSRGLITAAHDARTARRHHHSVRTACLVGRAASLSSIASHRIAEKHGKKQSGRTKSAREPPPPPPHTTTRRRPHARTAKRSRQPTNNLRWPGHQSRPVPAEFSRVQFKRAAVGDATDAVPT